MYLQEFEDDIKINKTPAHWKINLVKILLLQFLVPCGFK